MRDTGKQLPGPMLTVLREINQDDQKEHAGAASLFARTCRSLGLLRTGGVYAALRDGRIVEVEDA